MENKLIISSYISHDGDGSVVNFEIRVDPELCNGCCTCVLACPI
ncbi:MAG: 4Fe-4S binding protein, partial [Promethearchaeota archaeon]